MTLIAQKIPTAKWLAIAAAPGSGRHNKPMDQAMDDAFLPFVEAMLQMQIADDGHTQSTQCIHDEIPHSIDDARCLHVRAENLIH